MDKGLILLAHGSKLDMAKKEAEALSSKLDEELNMKVKYANLQFVKPSFWDVLKSFDKESIKEIAIMPLFIFSGSHVNQDIPKLLKEAREEYPKLEFSLLSHLTANQELFRDFLREKLKSED